MNKLLFTLLVLLATTWTSSSCFGQVASATGFEPGGEVKPVSGSVAPDSFRINNKVFVGKNKTPVSSTATLFYKGRVYDFMSDPMEIIIYDPEMQRFLIISSVTKTQCSVTVGEVLEFEKMMREALTKTKDEFIRTCFEPEFEIFQDTETSEWVYQTPRLTYRIKTKEETYSGQAVSYADFANKYALLNVILTPQSMPPFARIIVNNDLAKKGLLPTEIHITLQPKINPLSTSMGKESFSTVHNIIQGLGDGDMNQIRKAGEYYGQYKQVSFEQYQKLLQKQLQTQKEK